jgi:RHH-type rel operon transcriptional repressor/antitoxin RelB
MLWRCDMTTTTALRLPEDLAKRYDRLAKETGRTKTYYMTEALADSIDQLEYEYGILKQVEDFRAGRLKTYSLDEVGEMLGLDD